MTPQIIAHRGASYLAPENTLTAFKKAMEIGADGVEMDVQQTIDAGLVIHHDYMIDLHTDISGKIYDMTMGDLKELDFGSWKDAIFQDEKWRKWAVGPEMAPDAASSCTPSGRAG